VSRKIFKRIFASFPSSLKVKYYKRKGMKIGSGTKFDIGSIIKLNNYKKSRIGKYCLLDENVEIIAGDITFGDEVYILRKSMIFGESSLNVGDYSKIGPHAYIDVRDDVSIGKHVAISVGVIVNSHALWHSMFEYDISKFESVRIGDCAWVGAGAILLPGVKIGEHSIVGAGAVVTRDTPPYSIVAGIPARVIGDVRERKTKRSLEEKREFLVKVLKRFFGEYGIDVVHKKERYTVEYQNNIYEILIIAERNIDKIKKDKNKNIIVFSLIDDMDIERDLVVFNFNTNKIINWRHEPFLIKLKDFLLANYGFHFDIQS